MLVAVLLRCTDLRAEVDPLTGEVSRDARSVGLSPADGAALEHALRIRERTGARVLAVSAGPPGAEACLREALAVGAEVLRVPVPAAGALGSAIDYAQDLGQDERPLAQALVAALPEPPALVLAADRSADRGTGALPAFVAHELGCAQALGLVDLRWDDALLGERRLDGGRRELLRIPLPAVVSVEGAGVRLRRASLPAALAAATTEIPCAAWASLRGPVTVVRTRPERPRTRVVPAPTGDTARERLLALTGALVAHDPPQLVGPVDAPEAADALLSFLDKHGYLA